LDIHYERKANQSFMVVEGEPCDLGYEEMMLRQNEIKILLSFYTVEMNRRIQYWHDITGKQSLRDYLEREGLYPENLNQIIIYLGIAYEELTKYLISQQHILVTVDTVFVVQQGRQIELFFCYRPFEDMTVQQQLMNLMEYFLTIVDHKMQDFMKLCYDLYEAVSRGDFTMQQLQEKVDDFQQSMGQGEQKGPYVERVELKREPQNAISQWANVQDCVKEEDSDELTEDTIDVLHLLQYGVRKFLQKIQQIKDMPEKLRSNPVESEDDFIYEPEERYDTPTVLLNSGPRSFAGRLVYEGAGEEEDIIIDKPIFRIGSRDKDNDAILHSTGVSRHHARIMKQGEAFYLEDLNSTNGTYINGKQLSYKERTQLQVMDQIRFADVLYRIV